MAIVRPTAQQLQELAAQLHMNLTLEQAVEYLAMMQPNFDHCDLIDEMADEIPPVKYQRPPAYRPTAAENPNNAWYCHTEIRGAALARYDLLLPTVPMPAQPLPQPDCSLTEYLTRAFEMIGNTAPQDITGHPAMSVPCGKVDGLPVGMMLVGRHYAQSTLYQAAAAFEASVDWQLL